MYLIQVTMKLSFRYKSCQIVFFRDFTSLLKLCNHESRKRLWNRAEDRFCGRAVVGTVSPLTRAQVKGWDLNPKLVTRPSRFQYYWFGIVSLLPILIACHPESEAVATRHRPLLGPIPLQSMHARSLPYCNSARTQARSWPEETR